MLSIIIVNYNLSNEVLKCITTIFEKIKSIHFEILVVDNNSNDKSFQKLLDKASDQIKIIKNKNNLGFGKACNIGAANSEGDYLLFLNPDTLIEEDFFSEFTNMLDAEGIGILGVAQNGNIAKFDYSAGYFPTLFNEFVNVFFLGRILEAFNIAQKRKTSVDSLELDWVMGSFMMMKKAIFESVNGFDEDFFLFFEEVDLCKRIKSNGLKIVYQYNKFIHHHGSKGAKKNYSFFTKCFYESKKRFLVKHSTGLSKLLYSFFFNLQLITQIILWVVLLPLNKDKSIGKIQGFSAVLFGSTK